MQCPTKLPEPLLEFSLRVLRPLATGTSPSISLQLQITGSLWMFGRTLIFLLFVLLLSLLSYLSVSSRFQFPRTTHQSGSFLSALFRAQPPPPLASNMLIRDACSPQPLLLPTSPSPSHPTIISEGSSKRPSSGIQSQSLLSSPRKLEPSHVCDSELASTEALSVEGHFSGGFE